MDKKMFAIIFLMFLFVSSADSDPFDDCYKEPARAKCLPDTIVQQRYTYDWIAAECKPYNYGCGPTTNIYPTLEECVNTCNKTTGDDANKCTEEDDEQESEESENDMPAFCKLNAEPGMCYGYFRRFFFNYNTGKCERFVYGGCGGNENRFRTKTDCLEACGGYQ